MCGRYTLKSNLANWIGLLLDDAVDHIPDEIVPSYNIAPTQNVWTIFRPADTDKLRCMKMFWGLLPNWIKTKGEGAKLINARSETILEKPTFKKIVQTNRCVVPADGYYEWKKLPNGSKQPHWISRKDEAPFLFAGLWQANKFLSTNPEHPIFSVSIVTTHANDEFHHLHDRMPLMLFSKVQIGRWMNEEPFDHDQMEHFARPPAADDLKAVPVSIKVGNVSNQGPELITPVTDCIDG